MVIENRISKCLSAPEERHSQVELLRTSGARLRFVFPFPINILPRWGKKSMTLFLFLPGCSKQVNQLMN
jgi:hypothetical protein